MIQAITWTSKGHEPERGPRWTRGGDAWRDKEFFPGTRGPLRQWASDAQFRVIFSPTPLVGPDQPGRDYFRWPEGNGDNHANRSYQTEGNEIRTYLGSLKPQNAYVVCGDRHWQYFSVDPKTGLHEFSTGPVGDAHAVEPFPKDPRYHRFLRFAGGFLSGSVEGSPEKPRLRFRFHDTEGKILYEYVAQPRS